jgi:hypothetical protein
METDDLISVWHVYKEINREAYSLSKTGLQLAKGQWQINEVSPTINYEYFHSPFMEEDPPFI